MYTNLHVSISMVISILTHQCMYWAKFKFILIPLPWFQWHMIYSSFFLLLISNLPHSRCNKLGFCLLSFISSFIFYLILCLYQFGLKNIYILLLVYNVMLFYWFSRSNCLSFGHWEFFQLTLVFLWHISVALFLKYFLIFCHCMIFQAHPVYFLPQPYNCLFLQKHLNPPY